METHQEVSIVGGSIWGNRGAEAMLVTTIAQIRKVAPNTVFNVYTIYPDRDPVLVSDEKIRFLSGKPLAFGLRYFPLALLHKLLALVGVRLPLPESLGHMKASCCLLDMGGITFSDGRTLQLLYNVFSIWPAMLLDVPVVKLSQAMGPFEQPINHILARHFLPKCDRVFARGEITAEHLRTLNLHRDKYDRAADIAFLYQPEDSLSEENEDKLAELAAKLDQRRQSGIGLVSIIPSSLVFDRSAGEAGDYAAKLLAIIAAVCREGNQVVVLPNASRASSGKVMNNDLIVIDALRERAARDLPWEILEKLHWVDFDINARGIRTLVGKTDALVTSRFHGMVAGLSLCVPTMVIGWSHKYRETLADFGMDGYAINYEAGVDQILALFRGFWQDREQIKSQLEKEITAVRASASVQFEDLCERRIDGGSTGKI
ncbi:MAG: polysaccharide pyruvyl transferase family protein [Brevefilum sp.]|nr:polysaccharide pyruvyl transferase family protein [Brevefilum sp.]